jgi:hypothetical protein
MTAAGTEKEWVGVSEAAEGGIAPFSRMVPRISQITWGRNAHCIIYVAAIFAGGKGTVKLSRREVPPTQSKGVVENVEEVSVHWES